MTAYKRPIIWQIDMWIYRGHIELTFILQMNPKWNDIIAIKYNILNMYLFNV